MIIKGLPKSYIISPKKKMKEVPQCFTKITSY